MGEYEDSDLVKELLERASQYRQGGPSAEHTALLLEKAATQIRSDGITLHGQIQRVWCECYKIYSYSDTCDNCATA